MKMTDAELRRLAAAVCEAPSEANLVYLLDRWSCKWKHKGRTREIGPGAFEKYATLGLSAHGGIAGISRTSDDKEICVAVNPFLRNRFPGKTWTSIAILCKSEDGASSRPAKFEGAYESRDHAGLIFWRSSVGRG